MAVVDVVSAVVGRDPISLRPLAEIIDPDALDALFAPRENGEQRPGGEVSFIYSECRVTIQNSEYITAHKLDATSSRNRAECSDEQ
ncbi:HalOD1 output domain-containing protein [Haloarcula sp. GH36]|uniref:HalOD1 output domain-containing protein n=1 Tax=Haloarcula montana TaxID=3111776 RepID=UPI002D7666BA|nr:HalOD1 output domain-containing protein [Haloarcula sp. GH36]